MGAEAADDAAAGLRARAVADLPAAIYLAHGLALLIGLAMGVPAADFAGTFSDPGRLIKDNWGLPLWQVYLVWLTVLAILYPVASAYARYRAAHKHWWTSYL